MTSERIKEIQLTTAYPDSLSVQQALLQVWNECQQERMYSEKDLRYAFECATDLNPSFESFNAWFEQFKKEIR